MINSRSISELHPTVADLAQKLIDACKAQGIDIILTSTYRDNESQDELYKIGRTAASIKKKEKVVTNAKGGESYHQYRVAFDVVPIVAGKAIWSDSKMWAIIGKLGTDLGLEWAGNWKSFKEMPHFQFTNGLSLKDFQAGKTIDD